MKKNSPRLLTKLAGYIALACLAFSSSVFAKADVDLTTIERRLYTSYIESAPGGGESFYKSQQPDGTWPDIDYKDRGNDWKPVVHLERLHAMAASYQRSNSTLYRKPELLNAITRGLDIWYSKKPAAENWWFNDIGQQLVLEPILILMHGPLNTKTFETGAKYMLDPKTPKKFPGGLNLMWYAGEQLVRGLLLQDPQDVSEASGYFQQALKVRKTLARPLTVESNRWTTGEGIQTDYSFHQHGPQLYSGGYGLGALSDGITYMALLQNTRFAFSQDSAAAMTKMLLLGTRFMLRGTMFEQGAAGRTISRPGINGKTSAVADMAEELAKLQPAQANELNDLARHIHGSGKPYSFLGHRHFWNSDFSVHQRSPYYFSVKMVSSRTNGTESMNGENLKGYWLPFGMTSIAQDGKEFVGLQPVWDWTHLPGVTSLERLPTLGGGVNQKLAFVGGVSDATFGASAMQFETADDSAAPLSGKKAWFFFDNEIVALGIGIASTDRSPVNTTLNQTLLRGEVVADGKTVNTGTQRLSNARWILHDRVGYVLPGGSDVTLKSGLAKGSWNSINATKRADPVSANVFSLWLSHGVRPTGAGYSYVVVPNTDAGALAAYSAKMPISLLANTNRVQAVQHKGLGLTQAVFYTPGTVNLGNGLTLTVDQPSMVMVKDEGQLKYTVTVSSPVASKLKVQLANATSSPELIFEMPENVRTGESLSSEVVLNVRKGYFRVRSAKRVYWSNGDGDFCYFAEWNQFALNGGTRSTSVTDFSANPGNPNFRTAPSCALSVGFFRIGETNTVYKSNGKKGYCSFANREDYLRMGGVNDFSNVYSLKAIPPVMQDQGRCK